MKLFLLAAAGIAAFAVILSTLRYLGVQETVARPPSVRRARGGRAPALPPPEAAARTRLHAGERLNALLRPLAEREDAVGEGARALLAGDAEGARARLEASPDAPALARDPAYAWALAKARLASGDRAGAVAAAERPLTVPGLSARTRAQAWAVLRELGHRPSSPEAGEVLGVVAETGSEGAMVFVAAYADGEARVFWSPGAGEAAAAGDPDAALLARLAVEAAAREAPRFAEAAGDLPLPAEGWCRLTILTPGGTRTAYEPVMDLRLSTCGLHPVFTAMQALLAAMRVASRA